MRTGYVDETWAREHHAYWYDDIAAGKIPAAAQPPLARPTRPTRIVPRVKESHTHEASF